MGPAGAPGEQRPLGTDAASTGSDPRESPASTPAVITTTPAADFCRSGDALEYGAKLVVLLWNIDASRDRVIAILEQVVEENDGVLTTDASVRIGTEMAVFEQHVTDLTELTPPDELEPAYQLLELSAAAMMDFSTALQTGVFLSSSEDISEAADNWVRARELRDAYDERMLELCWS